MNEVASFKVNQLFIKKTVKGYTKKDEKLTPVENGYHIFGQNIKYQYPQKVLLDKKYLFKVNPSCPILAYASSTGSIGIIEESFYRSGDNGAFQALIPKFSNYNYRHLLYILTCLKKIFDRFNYASSINNIPELSVFLPIDSSGQINLTYMEDRIKELEQDRVKELEHYLIVSGLNDYHLTKNDIDVLSYKPNYVDFKIIDIFDVENTHSILKSQIKKLSKGTIPYLTAAEGNNAVFTYISCPDKWVDRGNCVFIGGKTMTVTYQESDFCSNDSHNLALYLKEIKYKKPLIQQYLVGSIKKSLSKKYSWGDSISKKKIQKDVVKLPVISNSNKIDFDYMEKYITAIQKLAIRDVVDYKDKLISETKSVIEK